MSIKVSIVDDEVDVRKNYSDFLNQSPGFCCVSVHPHGAQALRELPHIRPDIALIDINLPRLGGVELVRRLSDTGFSAQFVMLTKFNSNDLIVDSFRAGAVGYLLKGPLSEKLLDILRVVHAGGSLLTPEIARKVVRHFHDQRLKKTAGSHSLSPREEEVLRLVRRGLISKEIGVKLGITKSTVDNHVRRVLQKLHVNSRLQAVNKFFGPGGP